jgi:hypothetical protein
MFGPGEYVSDPTEGIVDIPDLPRPPLVAYSRTHAPPPAHAVAIWPLAINPGSAPYTILAICLLDARWICW